MELAEELSVDGILDMLLSLPSGKATGEDCIPNDLLRVGERSLAALMSSLSAKACVRAEAPVSWQGGAMVTVPKKAGLSQCDGHRGILTSSTVGKTYSKALRRMVVPLLHREVRDSQQGGIAGRCALFDSHTARLMMDRAA